MLIYISGKLTENGECLQEYVDVAMAYGVALMQKGHAVIIPHLNYYMPQVFSYDRWLRDDLEIIEHCDALFLIPNWTTSFGAKTELKHAIKHHIPVFDDINGVPPAIHPALRRKLSRGELQDIAIHGKEVGD